MQRSQAEDGEELLANKHGLFSAKQDPQYSGRSHSSRGGYRRGARGRPRGRAHYSSTNRSDGMLLVPVYAPYQMAQSLAPQIAGIMEQASQEQVLSEQLQQQLEYYFSQDNLIRDIFLRGQMDSKGYVELQRIASFNRVRMLTQNVDDVTAAARNSSVLKVKGGKVRKRKEWWKWVLPPMVETQGESSDEEGASPRRKSAVETESPPEIVSSEVSSVEVETVEEPKLTADNVTASPDDAPSPNNRNVKMVKSRSLAS